MFNVLFGEIGWNLLGIHERSYQDFFFFYSAGKSWLLKANPYVGPFGNFGDFLYPPTILPFFGMFALFDLEFASQLWTATYLSLFVVALVTLAFTVTGERRWLLVSIAVLLFLSSSALPVMAYFRQSDLLVASLAILSLVGQRLKHHSLSAVLLSMAVLMKCLPILLLIYFVAFRRDLQYLARFLVSSLAIVGASLLVVPIQLYSFYLTRLAPILSIASSSDQNYSIVRYVSLAGMSRVSPFVSLAGVGLFALFSLYVNPDRSRVLDKKPLLNEGMFLMNVLVMLLLGPKSWHANYVWVILPLALFLSGLLMEETKLAYLALIGIETFLLNSAWYDIWQHGILSWQLNYVTIGNLMMLFSLIPIFMRRTLSFVMSGAK